MKLDKIDKKYRDSAEKNHCGDKQRKHKLLKYFTQIFKKHWELKEEHKEEDVGKTSLLLPFSSCFPIIFMYLQM